MDIEFKQAGAYGDEWYAYCEENALDLRIYDVIDDYGNVSYEYEAKRADVHDFTVTYGETRSFNAARKALVSAAESWEPFDVSCTHHEVCR